jgi:hypothetical protein
VQIVSVQIVRFVDCLHVKVKIDVLKRLQMLVQRLWTLSDGLTRQQNSLQGVVENSGWHGRPASGS